MNKRIRSGYSNLHSMNHCLIWSCMVSFISGPSVSRILSLMVSKACWYSCSCISWVILLWFSVFTANACGVFFWWVGNGGGNCNWKQTNHRDYRNHRPRHHSCGTDNLPQVLTWLSFLCVEVTIFYRCWTDNLLQVLNWQSSVVVGNWQSSLGVKLTIFPTSEGDSLPQSWFWRSSSGVEHTIFHAVCI